MQEIVLITNPISGNGASKKAAIYAQRVLKKHDIKANIAYTEYAGHAIKLANELKSKYKIIVAVGGDGTVNEVAQSLVGSNSILGIIPKGSGNGLARHLGIPMSLKGAIQSIINQKTAKIDAPQINGEYFFCTAGVGYDALISHQFSKMNGRGLKNYVKAILMEFKRYKSQVYTLDFNKERHQNEAFVITVANAAQYGNDAYIAPTAKIDDEQLEITILPKPSLWMGLNFGLRLFRKNIHLHPKVKHLQSNEITIRIGNEGEAVIGHKDGEPETWTSPLKFSIEKEDKLNVIVNKDNI